MTTQKRFMHYRVAKRFGGKIATTACRKTARIERTTEVFDDVTCMLCRHRLGLRRRSTDR